MNTDIGGKRSRFLEEEIPANGIRGYTGEVRLRGLRSDRDRIQEPAQTGFVCIDAVSNRPFFPKCDRFPNKKPANAGFIPINAMAINQLTGDRV